MQELIAEGLPTNPFSPSIWPELKDALESQERPVIPDAMSEDGDLVVTSSLAVVPSTGKWNMVQQADTGNAAEEVYVDVAKLMESAEREAEVPFPSAESQEALDNHRQAEQEEPSKPKGTGTGLYDTDDEDPVDTPEIQAPKQEVTQSGAIAIALTTPEAPHEETPLPHSPTHLVDTIPLAQLSLDSHAEDPTEPSPSNPSAPITSTLFPSIRHPNETARLNGQHAPFPFPLRTHLLNPLSPTPDALSAITTYLADALTAHRADIARIKALQRHIRSLRLEPERGTFARGMSVAPRPSVVGESIFGDGRGVGPGSSAGSRSGRSHRLRRCNPRVWGLPMRERRGGRREDGSSFGGFGGGDGGDVGGIGEDVVDFGDFSGGVGGKCTGVVDTCEEGQVGGKVEEQAIVVEGEEEGGVEV